MGNAQQKHHSKGKQKGAKDGPREAFQTGDDTFERIEKEEVKGVDPLGNEAAALDDLVERLDSFSVPRKPVPPPVLNRSLVDEESSLPLSFSSGFQPGGCSKNVVEAPAESSNHAPSIQERVTEIRESTGDKHDEEPLKHMDKAESSGAAAGKVVQDAAESEAELDLMVTGVKLVDGTVEIQVELPETAGPSDEVNGSAEPVKASEPQEMDQEMGDAAEAEFEVELPVTGVKPAGDKIEVEVGLPETAVSPPLQSVTDSVPSVADNKGAENLTVKATESGDWNERLLDTTKDQETESAPEAGTNLEEISLATSSDKEQSAEEVTGSPEVDEEVEMIVPQADNKDIEQFKEPVTDRVRTETTGTAKDIHEEAALTSQSAATQELTDTKESTLVQHATSISAEQEAEEHEEKLPHEEAGQKDSGEFHEEDGGTSQDELRSHFAVVGDDQAFQAGDGNFSKTEDGEASAKDGNLDTSSPVEVFDLLKQSGTPVDGSPSGATEAEEAEGAEGGNGPGGIVLEPEQIRDLIPEADDGSVQDQLGDAAVVEDFKADDVVKEAPGTNHKADTEEPEAESLKLQGDSEDSSTNKENQEKTTQTDGLEASKDDEEAATPLSQGSEEFKEPEIELAPQIQGSAEFKEPEIELAPQVQGSAEFKDALELVPQTQGSEDFKDAVSELDLPLENQGQEGVKNAEPETEAPEIQGLQHAEPESLSSEDLQDAEPVFETPRGVEVSEAEFEPVPEFQGFEEVESAEQESEPAVRDAEVSEPADEVERLEEVEYVEPAEIQRSKGMNAESPSGQPAQLEEPPATELLSFGAHEVAHKPALEADDAEASPVMNLNSSGVEGTEPSREKPDSEVDGAIENEELIPNDQESVTREAHEEKNVDGQGPANDQQTQRAEGAQPAAAKPMQQADEDREERVTEQADREQSLDVQGSEPTQQLDVSKQEPGIENEASEAKPEVDFDETSQVELETLVDPEAEAKEAAQTQVQGPEAEDAKPEVDLQEDKPVSELSHEKPGEGGSGAAVGEVDREEQPGIEPFRSPTGKANEGLMGDSQVVVTEELKPSRAEIAKEPNDEAEAAESGALVLPGMARDVAPVVSELKSEPELTGEADMTNEELSLDGRSGHSRSVDSLEVPAGEQNAEPVSVSASGYQEPESSKICDQETGATAEVAAEGDSSEASWSKEPSWVKWNRDEEPVPTTAAEHAALADSARYKEPDPDDVQEAEAKVGQLVSVEEPVAGEPGEQSPDMQVEERSSPSRVKIVPGHDIGEDLHNNSEVPVSDVITEQKEAPSSSSIEAIANEEVISKMDNEPVNAGKAWTSQDEKVEVPGNVAGVEVL